MSAAPHSAPQPLQGGQLVLGTVALSLAVIMNVLDSSIANVSIPAISGDLGVSPQQGTWVITSFAVSNAIAVPLTGWLTMRIGQVKLFIGSMLLFVIASLLCGLAPNIGALIAARILQGAVAGPMIPLSQALLLSSYPPAKNSMALAFWGMTTLVAPIMGPLLGGGGAGGGAGPGGGGGGGPGGGGAAGAGGGGGGRGGGRREGGGAGPREPGAKQAE